MPPLNDRKAGLVSHSAFQVTRWSGQLAVADSRHW